METIQILNEYEECKLYWEWSRFNPILREYLVHHVNEGKRSIITGKRLKDIGLTPGLPDYQLIYPNHHWHGFFLEMKRSNLKSKPQPILQKEWMEKLRRAGFYANFAYGFDDAMKQTMDYLTNKL